MSTTAQWYDRIAWVYDTFTGVFYRSYRQTLVSALAIRSDDRILSVACGTGQSFPFYMSHLGPRGQLVGIDYSKQMLARAQRRVQRQGWSNVTLRHMDARALSVERLAAEGLPTSFTVVVGELAFSVIPEWQEVMRRCVALLVPGGRLGVLDWYRPRRDLLTWIVNLTACADVSRDIIGEARRLLGHFVIVRRGLGGNIFVGVGRRKRSA